MSNNNLDKMSIKFKEFSELQMFAEAQQKTIVSLTKKLNEKEDEIKHLKKLIEGAVPLLPSTETSSLIINLSDSDEKNICKLELNKLKKLSLDRELTLEEAKKVDIYSKLLLSIDAKTVKPPRDVSPISDDDLLIALKSEK